MQKILIELRNKRVVLGFSQEYLGLRLGISQKSYSKIESGKTKISLEVYIRICIILNISPKELL